MKRANLLVALGAVLVVAGLVLAWTVGRDDGEGPPAEAVAVVVAKADLSPGEAGDDLVAAGKVAVERLPADEVADGALRATAELHDAILGAAVAEGDQVVAADVRPALLRGAAIDLPEGQRAVAVTVPFTAGMAGYAGPGDRVDVYVTIPPDAPGAPQSPHTELLLAGVEVLDTSDEVAPRRSAPADPDATVPVGQTSRAEADSITLLLSVAPGDAERLVFAASVNQLWFGLAGEEGPDATPSGVGYDQGYLEGGR